MKKSDKRIINRMNIVFFLFLLFSFFVIGKIFYLQNAHEQDPSVLIETIKNVEVESSRGNIYSENGDLIDEKTPAKDSKKLSTTVPLQQNLKNNLRI